MRHYIVTEANAINDSQNSAIMVVRVPCSTEYNVLTVLKLVRCEIDNCNED